MKIQRTVTAEGKAGVATRIDTIDTATINFLTNIRGFDKVPGLPVTPEQVLSEYRPLGIIAQPSHARCSLWFWQPSAKQPNLPVGW
jgi:hypothetical protein